MSKTFIDKTYAVVPELGMLSIVSMTTSSRFRDEAYLVQEEKFSN